MKYRLFCLLLSFSLSVVSPLYSQTNSERGVFIHSNMKTWGSYHALIIGINEYKEWPRLQTAVKDASVLKHELVMRYGFDEKHVILRTDKEATRRKIIKDLRYLAVSMKKTDNLLIYFAGHGQLDKLTGDGYWIPVEGELKEPYSWVSNYQIKHIFGSDKMVAKNVIIIADSCYSGSMLRGGPSLMSLDDRLYLDKLRKQAMKRSRQVISPGGVEPVADGGADGHSLFAFYLINALRENDREVIDLENLFHTRVWKQVTEIGNQRPNVGRLKTPMDEDGQFVLYNVAWAKQQAALAAERKRKALEKAAAVKAAEKKQQNFANMEKERAALEIENLKRAQAKAAAEKAELDLQRQRIEMEKQRLELEKQKLVQEKNLQLEMLKQQQANELERLKLEKQKQEIEYAKLHARLEEIERARKEANLSASVSNVDMRERYRLAIFPVNYFSSEFTMPKGWGGAKIVKALSEYAFDDSKVDLVLSYAHFPGYTENIKILSDIDSSDKNKYWKRQTIFSPLEPEWKNVEQVGPKTSANFAVMASVNFAHSTDSVVQVYLYEFKTKKVYFKEDKCEKYAVGRTVRDLVKSLLRKYEATISKG